MIALDNGPAHGDYARYIEALLTRRAAVPLLPSDAGDAFASTFQPPDAPSADPGTQVVVPPAGAAQRPRESTTPARRAVAAARSSGNTLSATQAAAIATAMMNGGRNGVSIDRAWIDVLGIVVGVVLFVVGLFVQAAGPIFIVAGIAVAAAMFKRIVARQAAPGTGKRA